MALRRAAKGVESRRDGESCFRLWEMWRRGEVEFQTGLTGLTEFETQGMNRQYSYATRRTSVRPQAFVPTDSSLRYLFDIRRIALLHFNQMAKVP